MNKDPHTSSASSNSGWDNLKQVPFSENYQPESADTETIFFDTHDPKRPEHILEDHNKQAQRLEHHGAKIINALHTGNYVTKVDTIVTDSDREEFYDWVNNGQLTPSVESQFLQTIALPMSGKQDNAEKTLAALSSPHEHRILAYASGRGFKSETPASVADFSAILEKYPTPVEFQSLEKSLIDIIQQPKKRLEYQADLEVFKQKFYGKRQEYHEAWQNLEREARSYQVLNTPSQETPAEHAQKIAEGVYAEYIYPSDEQIRALQYQSEHQSDTVVDNSVPPSAPAPKKGILGKLFGRKK